MQLIIISLMSDKILLNYKGGGSNNLDVSVS